MAEKEGIQETFLKNKEIWQHTGKREVGKERMGESAKIFGFKGLEGCWCISEMEPWEGPREGGAGNDASVMGIRLRGCKTFH